MGGAFALAPGQAFSLFFMTDESLALTLGRMVEDCVGASPTARFSSFGLCVYTFEPVHHAWPRPGAGSTIRPSTA
jgi:hypothetical protein